MSKLKRIGAKIKEDYPEYHAADEERLALVIKENNPEIYQKYDEPETFFKPQAISFTQPAFTHRRSTALEKYSQRKIEDLTRFYNPSIGRFRSSWRLKKAQTHLEIQKTLTENQRLVIQEMEMTDRAIIDGRKRQVEFDYFVKENAVALIELQAKAILIEAATNIGLPLEQYINLREAELHLTLRNREYDALMQREVYAHAQNTKIELEAEQTRSEIQIEDFFQRKKIELDSEIQLAEAELRLGIVADYLQGNQQVVIIQNLLDQTYLEIEDILNSNNSESTKQRMIEDREETIRDFKRQKNETSNRLLSKDNRQET